MYVCMYMYPRENCTTHVRVYSFNYAISRAVVQDQRILDLSVSSSLNDLSGTQLYLDFLWMNVQKKILIVNTGSDTFDHCQKSNLPADAGYVISALYATVGSIYHM